MYCGQLRNFDRPELIKQNIENLFGRFPCDLFVSCWDTRGYSFSHGQAKVSAYALHGDISRKQVENVLAGTQSKVCDFEIENFDAWLNDQKPAIKQMYQDGFRFGSKVVPATSFPQLYKIERANQLKTQFEKSQGFKYDIVVRFRPDMCLASPIPTDYLALGLQSKMICHLNTPQSFFPCRIYDIFFFGNSDDMDVLCSTWSRIDDLLKDPFENKLPVADACRLLYLQAIRNGFKVVDMETCIGDIYRDEPMDEYLRKIAEL